MTMANAHSNDKYYIPHSSPWPLLGSVSLFVLMAGAALTVDGSPMGSSVLGAGFLLLFALLFFWFRTVVNENQAGTYNLGVDQSFRMAMRWFIFSEVMFFAAFFGALFYVRELALPWLSGTGAKHLAGDLLWPQFGGGWPTNGPQALGPKGDSSTFETIPALGVPLLNTLLLLSSGVTITIAHHALRAGKRGVLKLSLAATFILGFIFVYFQGSEYHHAYTELGLTLGTGIYGSTFFMLTGFHGLHVTIGAIMLLVIWLRVMSGHFTPERHFAFEAVAWYWHFVDVVWLGLYIFVYWM